MEPLIVDIVFIAIIVLFAIIGLAKGFYKSLFSLVGTIVSLVISFFLAGKVAAAWLPHAPMAQLFGDNGLILNWFTGMFAKNSALNVPVGDVENAAAALTGAGVPAVIAKALAAAIASFTYLNPELTFASVLGTTVTGAVYWLVIALLLFLGLRLIIGILNIIFRKLTENKTINGINRFLGFLLGAVKGTAFLAIGFGILSFFSTASFLSGFNGWLSESAIAGPFSNYVYEFVGEHIDLDNIIKDVFGDDAEENEAPAGDESTEETAAFRGSGAPQPAYILSFCGDFEPILLAG